MGFLTGLAAATGLGLALAIAALAILHAADAANDRAVWAALRGGASALDRFDPATVDSLPEPARRYFLFAIAPGTPLSRVVELQMEGDFGLGDRQAPNYAPMQARQILSFPDGFVWKMKSGMIGGSDGLGAQQSWTRFRLFGLIPVARSGGTADHRRSAFARLVAEAVFWAPASVLPGPGVDWQAIGPDTARLTVTHQGMTQPVDLTVDATGAPLSMVMPRWSNANPQKRWQIQPFGAIFGATRRFGGFHLPVEVQAGNFFGTEDWYPFFRVRVTEMRFSG